MLEFSISAMLDGLIHLSAFLSTCAALYLLLSIIAKNKFESHVGRTVVVVSSLVIVKVYTSNAEWAANIVVVIALLFCLSFVLILRFLRAPLLVSCLVAMALVSLFLSLEHVADQFSAKVMPEGTTFAEYMGLAQTAIDENKTTEGLVPTNVGLNDVMSKGLDALATLTEEEELESMSKDFGRGMELFAERKAWMDGLTPEEKLAYREEMAVFLIEQGLAEDRYSLAAIKDADPGNLATLASLFSELNNEGAESEKRARSISESVAVIASNFGGFKLDDKDMGMLRRYAELFAGDEIEEAIVLARQDLWDTKGESRLSGAMLTAMIQMESNLPIDQLLGEEDGINLLDTDTLRELAFNHWSREKMPIGSVMPTWVEGDPESTDLQSLEVIDEPEKGVGKELFLAVKIDFGVVLVPNDETEMYEWVAATYNLRMKGYVSLGDEVVILREDGSMLRRMDAWSVEKGDYIYCFTIEHILKGRVTLRAAGREPVAL